MVLVIGVEDDSVTPTHHALMLYEIASAPIILAMQGWTSHYDAYKQYGDIAIPEIVDSAGVDV